MSTLGGFMTVMDFKNHIHDDYEIVGGTNNQVLMSINQKGQWSNIDLSAFGAEPAFTKNTAFNKNFGTGNTDVARGNHTHTSVDGATNATNINVLNDTSSTVTYPMFSTGTSGNQRARVCSTATRLRFNATSKKEEKEEIEEYKKDALELINKLKIVSYKYKEDPLPRVGFIAEDSDSAFTNGGKGFDINSSIGILLKAVQELSQEIERLKKIVGE